MIKKEEGGRKIKRNKDKNKKKNKKTKDKQEQEHGVKRLREVTRRM